jgi:filamentous hemagglutinin
VQAVGALSVNAQDINIQVGLATQSVDEAHQHTRKGLLSKSTVTTREANSSSTALASNFGGNTVNIKAVNDIAIKGSNVVGDSDTTLIAKNNITIEAAQNTSSSNSYRQERKSGFSISSIGASPIGWSYSKTKQSDENQNTTTTAAASTVGSVGGNVNITAGNQYKQVGSNVITPTGDIKIQAKMVEIQEARKTNKQSSEQKFEQTSISTGLKGGIIDSVQATTQAVVAAKDSSTNRNRALNVLIAYAKGSDAYEQGKAVEKAYNAEDPSAAAGASGIKVSVSIGNSKSQSNSSTTSDTAAGSTVKAGGNVNIKATQDDLTIQGSNVSAAKDVSLSAAQDVNILASADTESNRSSNSSSSISVGVSVGVGPGGAGLSLDLAASRGKGQANSDSTTYNNSHVNAGNAVNLTSGADTNVVGGNIKATQVTADVGGNLNVESLQDIAVSEASQKNTGIALSIPIVGTGGSASFRQSKQNSNSSYASVNEQSGIQAGDGGFQVNVKGNTDLKGATIASTDKATQEGKNVLTTNTLTTSDINNSMSASASSSGVSVGTNMMDGKYAMAKAIAGNALNNGSANQSDASTTISAISGTTVTIGNKTTDTSKEQLTDSNGKAVSTDTSNTSRTLAKADVAGLQRSAQDQQASNMLLVNAMTVVGDKIYRKETEQKRLDRISCESANKENCSRQENVTLDQVKAVNGKITAINNGMLNIGDQAAIVAYMQSTGMQLQDGVLVVVNPKINDALSEAAWVAWKKVEQVFGFGTSSAGELNLALQAIAASQGAKLDTNSHSAGNFAVDEMLRKVQENGTTNAAIGTITMFGSPVNAQDTSDKVNAVTGGQGTTKQATHVNDFVGTLFGGNAPTGGNPNAGALDAHSSYTGELTTSDKNTSQLPGVKDLLAPEQIKNATDKSWGFSQPFVVPPRTKSTQEGDVK